MIFNKYLLLMVALLVMIVGVQAGWSLTLQQPEDFIQHITFWKGDGDTTGAEWMENQTGGNSMMITPPQVVMKSQTSHQTTYAAVTFYGNMGAAFLYNSSNVYVGLIENHSIISGSRIEMKVENGVAYLFDDGVLADTSQTTSIPYTLDQNPSYVGWGVSIDEAAPGMIDDIIWGSTESQYIFGMPDQGYWTGKQYFLMKDILNPAASGFYRRNTTDPTGTPTLIYSNTFTSTFGKNSGTNETVTLHSPTGGTGGTYYTGTAYAGEIQWNLTEFFASTAGYGLYQTDINPQTNSPGFATSEWIPYIGSGASIQFNKNSYAVGETATVTVVISDGYYDLAIYSYHVVIQDIYGTEVYDQPITFSALSPYTGTAEYTWTDAETEGVYYGLIYAHRLADHVELLMNYDTCDLNSNLIINGYVFDGQNATVISGATVNVTQGVTTDSLTTASDGNYSSTSAFSANAPTTLFASAPGFDDYQTVFTPLYAGTIQINLTLMPTSPTFTGIALGGIARTPPYNRTINSATISIVNTTDGHSYLATTNSVGYYIQNNMAGPSHLFNIWGSKSGFSNSTIYQKLVVGI